MKVGVDLGTDSVLAWVPKQGVVVREPAILARDAATGRVLASGQAAQQMLGRVSSDVRLLRPIEAGRVAEPDAAAILVADLLRKNLGWRWSMSPGALYVAVGEKPQSYGWQALLQAFKRAQLGRCTLAARAIAAARGAGLPVDTPQGQALIDLGAGSTEITIVSLGQIVVNRSLPMGGRALDEAIRAFVADRHGLEISTLQGQELKHELGWATPGAQGSRRIWGRRHATGLPHEVEVTAEEITEALSPGLSRIVTGDHQALEQVPPGLAADLVDGGLLLTGGGALLRGLDTYLADRLHLPVRRADDPLACAASGAVLGESKRRLFGRFFSKRQPTGSAK